MKKLLLSILLLSSFSFSKEYNFYNLLELDGLWTKKFSTEIANGKVWTGWHQEDALKMKSVFKIHESIVNDYKSYVSSFIQIKNDEIRDIVESDIELGKLWPEALLRFNPSFEKGESVKSLIDTNVLDPELENVFTGYDLYKHQVDALRLGTENKDFIVTSGTGSGKSLTFIGTIFDNLFKSGKRKSWSKSN